jgi:hypothetical protein
MPTIVMNTLNAAVTEYDWVFQSVTPTHAGDASGLYLLGGELDDAAAIPGHITTGVTLCGSSLKKRMAMIFLSIKGAGQGLMKVIGKSGTWSYPVQVQAKGLSRAKPGLGINENYLGFGYSNVAGADFELDRIEVDLAESKQQRTGT